MPALIAILLGLSTPSASRAQALVADLSNHLVAITSGFNGAEILLFGAVEGPGDVVVTVRGPADDEAALARIRKQAAGFPHYAVPRAVWLTSEPWTVENTMLTPTLKLKRLNLQARFADEIERLYKR